MATEPQKCQRCSNPATHHVMKLLNDKIYDYILCADHARAISPTLKNNMSKTQQVNLATLLQHFLNQQQQQGGGSETGAGPASLIKCPNCHLEYGQYRKTLLLGCSDCYSAFEDLLVNDLRKFHGAVSQSEDDLESSEPVMPPLAASIEAAKKAVKKPKLEIPKEEQAGTLSLLQLKKELGLAVKHEDFQKAAKLRDQIRDFETKHAPKEKQLEK